ncbi:cysteine desulfurase-like protein [Anabaena cylindrica UHCC 0172]|uniref:cysteine desulfurase-like protein n=1 Tax=Anabaena cylindrica TaxID=1165 RepID=UPI002B213865|nr:cysteine desulfurase-like protein [Anabaena cylindrica]MEA5549382.1 cysteine desulfurase-like protein [Anabaena cylindrica UHCC 0172]
MESLDLKWIRAQFPALTQTIDGHPAIFFDGPGGTQIPGSVLDAMGDYLVRSNANAHGYFTTSVRTDALIISARAAIADLLGCDHDEVVFGANMTTLTFAVSRAIGRELQPGDEIIVTCLDHAANISPWKALEERGVNIRTVDINVADCTLDMSDLESQINSRTKLVAVSYASNAVGTINDIAKIVKLAHAVGALVFVDAVHYTPHGSINVHQLDCDFLACSTYKFFAPHVGVLYGKREHLARFTPYKVKPASEEVPSRWETGTLNHEGLAGVVAAINYLAKLGCHVSPTLDNELLSSLIEADREGLTTFHCPSFLTLSAQPNHELASAYHSRRAALIAAMSAIQQYERELSKKLISGLLEIPGLRVYGITEPSQFIWRTPTVSITIEGRTPANLAKILAEKGIFAWHGNFYAIDLTEKLGVEASGGLLRIGLVHYNTVEEIHQLLSVLIEI